MRRFTIYARNISGQRFYDLTACSEDPNWCNDFRKNERTDDECLCDALQDAINRLGEYEDAHELDCEHEAVFRRVICAYGQEAQLKMLLEEMSELQKEICKYWRGRNNEASIAEEIADVEIMLRQAKIMLELDNPVKKYINEKTERLANRLNTAQESNGIDAAGKLAT